MNAGVRFSLGGFPLAVAVTRIPLWSSSPPPVCSLAWGSHVAASSHQPLGEQSEPVAAGGRGALTQHSMGVMESGASAVSLSPAAEPFPARLVAKIKSGVFVDMKELLTDNISLLR